VAGLSILETALYASDLDAAERFYRDALGLVLDSREAGRHVFFRCADSMLLIFDPDTTAAQQGAVPAHGAHGPGHVGFAVDDGDFAPWLARLIEHGVEIEASVDWPGGGRSIYFRDPSGNSVELTTPNIWGIRSSD
jgi:catechol 2,3-dioxygenase-like lactoylglutathione lyase family enzyme